jgi:hypothetical protein
MLSDRTRRLITHSKKQACDSNWSKSDLFEAFWNKLFEEMEGCYLGIYEEAVRLSKVSVGAALRGILDQVKEASHYTWTELEKYQ